MQWILSFQSSRMIQKKFEENCKNLTWNNKRDDYCNESDYIMINLKWSHIVFMYRCKLGQDH